MFRVEQTPFIKITRKSQDIIISRPLKMFTRILNYLHILYI